MWNNHLFQMSNNNGTGDIRLSSLNDNPDSELDEEDEQPPPPPTTEEQIDPVSSLREWELNVICDL